MTQVVYADDRTLIDTDTPPPGADAVPPTDASCASAIPPANHDQLAARYAETLALLEAAEETIRTLHRHLETLSRPAPTCIYVTVAAGGTLYLNGGTP